jgi:hypothetical protein
MIVRTALVAMLLCVGTPAFADDTYSEVSMGELLARLPSLFKQSVRVQGIITGWGDLAALNSAVTREVMVDLRPLTPELRQSLNQTCTVERHCTATVQGQIVHIRGEGISELGIEPHTILFEPVPLN